MKRIMTVMLAAIMVAGAQTRDEAERMLKAAQNTEVVDGDLTGAIEQYRKIAESNDRAIAAQALIRMAGAYQKLATAQAREIYEQVVGEFADQTESAATAQARLAALRPTTDFMALRQVWDGLGDTISPDGRFMTYGDSRAKGNLAIRDLVAGTSRLLTHHYDRPSPAGYPGGSVISPDGRQVAHLWVQTLPEFEFQVSIIPLDGAAAPRIVHRSPNYLAVEDWAPDGQSLLVRRRLDDGTSQMALLSVQDGSLQQLKSFEGGGGIAPKFSPDGRYVAYAAPTGNGFDRDIFVLATDGSQEAAVVQHPANDNGPIWSPDGTRILFVSDRTATPSLWSVPVKDGRPAGEAELIRSDIGDVRPLRMTRAGTFYYVVSGNSRMDVYRAQLGEDGKVSRAPKVVADHYVNSNFGAALSPNGEELAYYSNRPGTVLVVRNLESGQERVFPLDFEINRYYFMGPNWLPDGGSVLVVVRKNRRGDDLLYRVDLATGSAEEVARSFGPGLKASPDGKAVFYMKNGSSRIERLDLASGRRDTVVTIQTDSKLKLRLGERLHVGNPAISPDGKLIAYMLGTHDETSFVVKPLAGGEPRVVFRPKRWGKNSAAFNTLAWTPDQRYLLFVKYEGDDNDIWRVPVDGGEAEKIGITMNAGIKAPQIHPDGRSLFFSAVEAESGETWALENFLPTPNTSE